MDSPRPSLSRRLAVAGLALLVALEVGVGLAFPWIGGGGFSYTRLSAARKAIVESPAAERGGGDPLEGVDDQVLMRIRDQVVHPFTGFVFDPAANSDNLSELLGGLEITEYGFIGRPGPLPKRHPDRLVIGITGGSVAVHFALEGTEDLAETLRGSPELADREIEFFFFALPGFKQPQQLSALAYLLTLGAEFDWILNLDGFNELALSAAENVPKGVAPVFPRSWYWRVAQLPDAGLERLRAEAYRLEDERRDLARSASDSYLRFSPAFNLVWFRRDASRAMRLGEIEVELVDREAEGEAAFVARGPAGAPSEGPGLWDHLTGIWERSSLAMHRLCEGSGIRYFHALQPNQYVVGSKPMKEAERRLAVYEEIRFREPVEKGYPRLIAAGRRLVAQGVAFHDMTMVFADVEQALYMDNCCHFIAEGNRILARALAPRLLEGAGDDG